MKGLPEEVMCFQPSFLRSYIYWRCYLRNVSVVREDYEAVITPILSLNAAPTCPNICEHFLQLLPCDCIQRQKICTDCMDYPAAPTSMLSSSCPVAVKCQNIILSWIWHQALTIQGGIGLSHLQLWNDNWPDFDAVNHGPWYSKHKQDQDPSHLLIAFGASMLQPSKMAFSSIYG